MRYKDVFYIHNSDIIGIHYRGPPLFGVPLCNFPTQFVEDVEG